MKSHTGSLVYGGSEITFQVQHAQRKTLEIAVHPDGSVIVKAPIDTSLDEVQQRLSRRARWVTKQLLYFQQFQPRTPKRRYLSGETHLYMGRQYRLKVIKSEETGVKLARGFLYVGGPERLGPKKVGEILDNWYLQRARTKFQESLDRNLRYFLRNGYEQPSLHIRKMKTRWGSLSSRGTLTLNQELIRAPRNCIDYVVTHELCHLKHKDHSARFYRLLEQIMPDWERRKHRLELALV
jgi:predicted metal-dependent hydrolase